MSSNQAQSSGPDIGSTASSGHDEASVNNSAMSLIGIVELPSDLPPADAVLQHVRTVLASSKPPYHEPYRGFFKNKKLDVDVFMAAYGAIVELYDHFNGERKHGRGTVQYVIILPSHQGAKELMQLDSTDDRCVKMKNAFTAKYGSKPIVPSVLTLPEAEHSLLGVLSAHPRYYGIADDPNDRFMNHIKRVKNNERPETWLYQNWIDFARRGIPPLFAYRWAPDSISHFMEFAKTAASNMSDYLLNSKLPDHIQCEWYLQIHSLITPTATPLWPDMWPCQAARQFGVAIGSVAIAIDDFHFAGISRDNVKIGFEEFI